MGDISNREMIVFLLTIRFNFKILTCKSQEIHEGYQPVTIFSYANLNFHTNEHDLKTLLISIARKIQEMSMLIHSLGWKGNCNLLAINCQFCNIYQKLNAYALPAQEKLLQGVDLTKITKRPKVLVTTIGQLRYIHRMSPF